MHHRLSDMKVTVDQLSDDDAYDAHLARSFVPVATQSVTEQGAVQQSDQCQSDHQATLHPTGAGDFLGQIHNQVTNVAMRIATLLHKHLQFRFFALNTEMRWCALRTGRIYIQQHSVDYIVVSVCAK